MNDLKLIFNAGIGVFALFFGSGNITLPLYLGAHAGNNIIIVIGCFMLTGVILPFIGLVSMMLYQGDYLIAYRYLGKKFTLLLLGLIILILGPLVVTPRCFSLIGAIAPTYLTFTADHTNIIYWILGGLVFLMIIQKNKTMQYIIKILAPLKISVLLFVIICGIYTAQPFLMISTNFAEQIRSSLTYGYNTMDLLASIFFSGLIYAYIVKELKRNNSYTQKKVLKICIYASIIGWSLLAIIYGFFFLIAASHAETLAKATLGNIIDVLSRDVMGNYGGALVFVTISLACFVTVVALTKACTDFFYSHVCKERAPYVLILIIVICTVIFISNFGFDNILKFTSPFIKYLYCFLVGLTIYNLFHYIYFEKRKKKLDMTHLLIK